MMNVTVCYCEIYQDKKGSEITGLEFKKAEWSLSRIPIPIMEHSWCSFFIVQLHAYKCSQSFIVFSYKFSFINTIVSASNPKEGGEGSTL